MSGAAAGSGAAMTCEGEGSGHLALTVGSASDPRRLRPTAVVWAESRHDGWPNASHVPATRIGRNATITAKWIVACGKLPD